MKWIGITLLALALAAILWFCPQSSNEAVSSGESNSVTIFAPPPAPVPQTSALLGETILADYAKPSLPPENDLRLLSHLMTNFRLLVKTAVTRPLSANEDWAQELRGFNPAQERFLPDKHAILNAKGQLVDRWGTPFFFHALSPGACQIRSAGPDRRLWTDDDIQLNPDDSFSHRAGL